MIDDIGNPGRHLHEMLFPNVKYLQSAIPRVVKCRSSNYITLSLARFPKSDTKETPKKKLSKQRPSQRTVYAM